MNLPRSAVTPKNRSNVNTSTAGGSDPEPGSDYMNIDPSSVHIYQNTSVLNLTNGSNYSTIEGASRGPPGLVLTEAAPPAATGSSNDASTRSNDNLSTDLNSEAVERMETREPSSSAQPTTHNNRTNSNSVTADSNTSSNTSSSVTGSSAESTPSRSQHQTDRGKRSSGRIGNNNKQHSSSPNKREALANCSFVEKKYGLITEDLINSYQVSISFTCCMPFLSQTNASRLWAVTVICINTGVNVCSVLTRARD